jgi:hypothetical protein
MSAGEPPSTEQPLRDPWLVAAWPGMGRVAMIAAQHLIDKLEGTPVLSIDRRDFFEINTVTIEKGVVQRPDEPKSILYAVRTPPEAPRDLLVFTGDPQPAYKGFEFCRELVDACATRGASRIVTFAAMATGVHPTAAARVFGVATEPRLLPMLQRHDVGVLEAGQISGLNGVLLAAAAERGLEGVCLLGELPGFAYAIPNPKAALSVLRAFARISAFEVDLSPLVEGAKVVERVLAELLAKMQAGAQAVAAAASEREEGSEEGEPETLPKPEGPDPETVSRIEDLFRRARQDRSQALALKAELDRLGLFRRYEDRFLDLFRKHEPEGPGAG